MVRIRPATHDDLPRLAEIELDAFVVWAKACNVSLAPMVTPDRILQLCLDHRLFLVAGEEGRAVGFAAGSVVGNDLYLVEIDVEQAAQGRGIGRALMLALLERGRTRGLSQAFLTTDRYVPFNAPFYETLGFRLLAREDTPAFLCERLDRQIEGGLDPDRRVAMALAL